MENLDFSNKTELNVVLFWRVERAFYADHAIRMLTDDSRRALAGAITDWLLAGGTPNYTAVRVNLPKFLASTPFGVFGEPMLYRTTSLVLEAVWPEEAGV